MPLLAGPVLAAGALRSLAQPCLDLDLAGPGPGRGLARPGLGLAGRLVLRPWRADDAGAVRAAFDCPDIQRWHTRRMDSDDEARDWTASWAGRWADETDASWAIADGDDRCVGQVGLRTVALAEAAAQLSYWVLPAARGTGVAAGAVRTLSRWTFGVLGLHRLFLVHSMANSPSCRVAHATGFRVEGTLRDHLLHADGWHDAHLHARLHTDP